MQLNFRTEFSFGKSTDFVNKIKAKIKIHTMRTDIHNFWKVGEKIEFISESKRKTLKKFADGICTEILLLGIDPPNKRVLNLKKNLYYGSERTLSEIEIEKLAYNDGFDSVEDFWLYFSKAENKTVKLIFWDLVKC
jgi:hypothetical protein